MRVFAAPIFIMLIVAIVMAAVGVVVWQKIMKKEKRWSERRERIARAVIVSGAVGTVVLMGVSMFLAFTGEGTGRFYLSSVLMTLSLMVFIPSLLFLLIHLLSLMPKLWKRRPWRVVSQLAIVVAVAAMLLCVFGVYNRKRLTVNEVSLSSMRLPESFDGMRVVQISDLHLGSFGSDTLFVGNMVDRINSLDPDLILFTGDIVSRQADEMSPFIGQLGRLKARNGVYAVLGNHDYGDYVTDKRLETILAERQKLSDYYSLTPFRVLRDENVRIYRFGVNGQDSIMVAGTENIGSGAFSRYGSLDKALAGGNADEFKILLTHDPGIWEEQIAEDKQRVIDLTLSGHTHAMQFKLFGWSPSSLRDKMWSGMYDSADGERHLYVNTGIGTVGPLWRIGATPEITLITLHHK